MFVNRYFYPDHSATSQLLSALAFALSEQGWDVHVVTSRQRYDAAGARLPARQVIRGVRVRRIWTTRFGRARFPGRVSDYLTFYTSAAWRLWRLARRGDVIVAETDPPMLSVVAAAVAKVRGARLVNWLQDLFPEVAQALKVRGVSGLAGRILCTLRNASLRRAYANVVLGEGMRNWTERCGVAASRVRSIPNWEDGEVIVPVARIGNRLRRAWALEDKFVVGYSGNMGRAHQFDAVVDAATRLRERADIAFLWIGDGAQRPWLEAEVRRRKLKSFVFKPYQPREWLFESLGVADVHLMSLNPVLEGLIVPSKFYGVAAAGRPAIFIGDPNGELPTSLREEQWGHCVRSGDGEALAKRIEQMSADLEQCRTMGVRARGVFVAKYDKPLALQRWAALIQELAA